MSDIQTENKMGVMPVGKLLLNMSTPMILSMLMQALYNIVDSIFVAMISEEALTAVSLAFPLQTLMVAFGIGTGVGVNALVSRYLGAKKFEKANAIATTSVYLTFFTYVVFAIFITLICRPFFRIQTSNPEIVDAGITYMQIVGILSIGMFFQVMMEKLLQSTGKTSLSMITQIVGACINMVMDPVLIFGLVGFPKLGIAGAAIATIFGQTVGGILALYFNKTKNKELIISFKKYPLRMKNVKKIYGIGLPSIIMQSIGSVMTFGFNKILINFSATATAVFGVYFKLQSFVLLPIIGLNNGMMPIIAYNFGARNPERIKQTLKYSYLAAYVMILIGFVLFVAVPDKMLLLFSASEDMLAIGVPALRIISLHFLLAAFSIVSSSFFQAMGHGFISMINAISRQLLVLLPAAYILSKIGGLSAVWWAFPIAELAAVTMATIFMIRVYRSEVKPLFNGA